MTQISFFLAQLNSMESWSIVLSMFLHWSESLGVYSLIWWHSPERFSLMLLVSFTFL